MSKENKKFPNTLYVKRDWDLNDYYYVSDENLNELFSGTLLDENITVGVYELVDVKTYKVKLEEKA